MSGGGARNKSIRSAPLAPPGENGSFRKRVGFDSLLELVKSLDMDWRILNEKPALGNP